METECPYRLLGISPSATEEDIIKAHRKLMKTHHPDKTDDPAATETSKRLNAAKARALASLAALKDRRSQEFELEAHIFALYGAISHTANHPLPLSAEIHARIKALVAQCKGETSAKLGPNPEIDGHYWLMRKLEQRNADDRQYHQEQLDTANRRIADLQARLDAESAARERAEKVVEEKEHIIDALTIRIKEFESNHEQLESIIEKFDETLLCHEQTLSKSTQTIVAIAYTKNSPCKEIDNHARRISSKSKVLRPTKADAGTGSIKKRKHTKAFVSESDAGHFQDSVKKFVQTHLTPSPCSDAFVPTSSIINRFKSISASTNSDILISKALKHTIESSTFPPYVRRIQHKQTMGYTGLVLK